MANTARLMSVPWAAARSSRQALTLPGKRGQQGPRGERGEKGDRGPPGQSAPLIVSWIVEKASYSVLPVLSDGTEGPRLELRPLFEQFHTETGP
jgi:hypothetical protein